MIDGTTATAIYAAVVATGALALEVRRWFESGPRLKLSIISEARMFGGPIEDEQIYLAITVSNLGERSTTITTACVHEINGRVSRWRNRWARAAVLADLHGQPLPHVLVSGTEWKSVTPYSEEFLNWARGGNLYVAVYSSSSSRPILKKITISAEEKPQARPQ